MEDNDVIQAFAPKGTNQPFDIGIGVSCGLRRNVRNILNLPLRNVPEIAVGVCVTFKGIVEPLLTTDQLLATP
jgi:hypothetical protein